MLAVVVSVLLHLCLFMLVLLAPPAPLALKLDDSRPPLTVDMMMLPASPQPAPAALAAPELQPRPDVEPLPEDGMAETVKVVRKKKAVQTPRPPVETFPPAAAPQLSPQPAGLMRNVATVAEPVTAARYDADYLNNPAPAYPALSRRLREEGRVLLRVQVSADGKPLVVEVKQSCGFERLDEAAKKAAERWRFVPARQGEKNLVSWVEVPVQFSLKK